ncbi:hypothetical protein QZH41_016474 [Actinostola sp. cb2023]|nr:hypothetical protein QZH41_016474 [Actinostola sp. cb2023]
MATMFRKSGNRKFRKKNYEENEEEDNTDENQSTDNNTINTTAKVEKVKSASKIEKIASTNSLLSFDHDEQEEEVFQVKKSKQSRRLSKKTTKDKTKKPKPRLQIKEEDENINKTRDVSPKSNGSDSKLDALRAELREMSKFDDEEDEGEDDDDDGADGSLKTGFTGRHEFNIPDAATIHALKKKREMARQLGTGQDYIPLDDSKKYEGRFDSKSRLVREDENDASDDEDGPISFVVPAQTDQALYGNVGSEDEEEEEEDEETKRWENEQIRKGVLASQVQQEKDQTGFGLGNQHVGYQGYNIYQYGGGYSLDSTPQVYNDDQPSKGQLKNTIVQKPTIESIMNRLKARLESLQETHRGRVMEKEKIISHSEVSEQSIEKLSQHGKDAERQYGFYQETRGYVRDLIECLDEKVGDTSRGKQKQSIKPVIDEFGRDMTLYLEECKQRRAAEREGRRMRRRRKREVDGNHNSHHEGLSSDDEETEIDLRQFKSESERIIQQSKDLFEDVVDNFSSIKVVKQQFEKWKRQCGDSYKNAYISLCLPKLFTMFTRIELIAWDPLNDDCQSLEEMPWYLSLVGFGFYDNEDIDPKDDDVKIIPSLIEKAVIPKLIGIVQHVWDPLSTRQTTKLIQLIQLMAEDYPTVQAENKTTRQLFSSIVTRLRKSVNDDVYVPLYPKQLLDSKSSGALAFFQRQYWSCYKLFSNILLWDGLLSPTVMQQLALDGLLNRYIILGLQHSTLYYDNLEKSKMVSFVCKGSYDDGGDANDITNSMPKSWLVHLSDNTLPTLETFSRFLVNLASCLQRSSAGCSDVEKKKARSATKKIIQYLLSLKAKDKASSVASEYGLDELIV